MSHFWQLFILTVVYVEKLGDFLTKLPEMHDYIIFMHCQNKRPIATFYELFFSDLDVRNS